MTTNTSNVQFQRLDINISVIAIIFAFGFGWYEVGLFPEGGAFELATVVTFFLTTFVLIARPNVRVFGSNWHLPVLTLMFALRELDFDKRFMETGILKLRLYTGDESMVSKLIGAGVIALFLICLYRLVRNNTAGFRAALRNREAWAIALPIGVVAVVVAKSIDGLGRKLAPFDITISDAQSKYAAVAEETLEFAFAALLLSSLILWTKAQQARKNREAFPSID